ncbi:hypothetical protein BO70DRAFT_127759 [Aspergillus heteromorphus CBS 117.55]|uniref:Uncharacterized protein n=1 Tax=Aspergillus heteromorphus CBS 117.55 TaxID=1448321 RepID=A0A317WTT3_9EURO|nr:uncharacterized protein BO70DRAFT_127759 [Aspergillus heteromorphus CBS 117.55]PWY89756.1 hypothetical protein BO70DRAFT_127759 [Aspergillus heteromorphus CBS 117.55]
MTSTRVHLEGKRGKWSGRQEDQPGLGKAGKSDGLEGQPRQLILPVKRSSNSEGILQPDVIFALLLLHGGVWGGGMWAGNSRLYGERSGDRQMSHRNGESGRPRSKEAKQYMQTESKIEGGGINRHQAWVEGQASGRRQRPKERVDEARRIGGSWD